MTNFTQKQIEALDALEQFVGQEEVLILTSGYTANVSDQAVSKAVATINAATLRGLEARGFIRIETKMWKGATISVLKSREQADSTHDYPKKSLSYETCTTNGEDGRRAVVFLTTEDQRTCVVDVIEAKAKDDDLIWDAIRNHHSDICGVRIAGAIVEPDALTLRELAESQIVRTGPVANTFDVRIDDLQRAKLCEALREQALVDPEIAELRAMLIDVERDALNDFTA